MFVFGVFSFSTRRYTLHLGAGIFMRCVPRAAGDNLIILGCIVQKLLTVASSQPPGQEYIGYWLKGTRIVKVLPRFSWLSMFICP